jgi:uncharacterized membrane protein
MATRDVIMPQTTDDVPPVVRTIGIADLKDVLTKGIDDFRAIPTFAVFLCAIYPIVALLLFRMAFALDVVPLLYPIAGGLALVGPVAAIGLYELSRRRELGLDTFWTHAFDFVHSPSRGAILVLGLLLLAVLAFWIATAQAIYVAFFGVSEPASVTSFLNSIFTTPEGWTLVIVGNAVGFLFAALVFVTNVVSFPILLDRNVGLVGAITTSVRVVQKNPFAMAVWGAIIAGALVLGALPLLIGLALVLPVLGHATWHLYRRVIEPDPHPRPEYHPRSRGISYGAQFPWSIFQPYRPKGEEDGKDR